MNELKKTLQTILERSLEVAEQTGQFAMEQAPEILEQFFAWHLAKHSLGCLLGLFLIIVGIVFFKLIKDSQLSDLDKGFSKILSFLFAIGSGTVLIVGNLYWVTFILVAPKIYLIEYFVK